jgi:hypothetical protein
MSSDGDELVPLTEASNETEASVICGFLQARGIRATYERRGELGSPFPVADLEPHVVFVRAADLQAARAALAETETNP